QIGKECVPRASKMLGVSMAQKSQSFVLHLRTIPAIKAICNVSSRPAHRSAKLACEQHTEESKMKYLVCAALAVFAVTLSIPEADAAVCARGVRGAACAGPRGAVAVRRPVARPVVVRRRVIR